MKELEVIELGPTPPNRLEYLSTETINIIQNVSCIKTWHRTASVSSIKNEENTTTFNYFI